MGLALPAAAVAGSRGFSGSFENGQGQVLFELDTKNNGKQEVVDYQFVDVPLDCKGDAETTTGIIELGIKVKNSKFADTFTLGSDKNPKLKIKVEGKFVSDNASSGTFSIKGRKVPLNGGGAKKCKSGSLDWSATVSAR
ncbi:MAG TPA: hypothetical protein VD766_04755 [Solirubrobacterales bacterium]|nr:hypothetical protein [Solirubrobacterales bacterium]